MKTERRVNLGVKIEGDAWLTLANPTKTIAQAVADFKASPQGQAATILEVDESTNRVRLFFDNSKAAVWEEVYVCDKCGAYSRVEAITVEHEASCKGVN